MLRPYAGPGLAGEDEPGTVVADKEYDSNCFTEAIRQLGAQVLIPYRANAKQPRLIDKNLYKDRNNLERFFNRIKHYRPITSRFDKTNVSFLAFLHLPTATALLHYLSTQPR